MRKYFTPSMYSIQKWEAPGDPPLIHPTLDQVLLVVLSTEDVKHRVRAQHEPRTSWNEPEARSSLRYDYSNRTVRLLDFSPLIRWAQLDGMGPFRFTLGVPKVCIRRKVFSLRRGRGLVITIGDRKDGCSGPQEIVTLVSKCYWGPIDKGNFLADVVR